jgi:L-threonylcarbamoyladenylate synthase
LSDPASSVMEGVAEAAQALRRGDLILLPTETVYGLGADAADPLAVAKIFEAKGRPRFNPLISHVSGVEQARTVARLGDLGERLAEAFWPGPLTIVAPYQGERVCDLARAGLDSVAVRAPAHPLAQGVIDAFGGAVVAPSANRSGRPSPTTFADAVEETGAAAAAALDGGPCQVGLESTVVSVLDGAVRLLRPGAVTRVELETIIGSLAVDEGQGHRSPGRLALHYAPDAPVRIEAAAARPGEILLGFGPGVGEPRWSLSERGDPAEAAARLFRLLREADRERPVGIAVSPVTNEGLGEAINDRLQRAAGFIG